MKSYFLALDQGTTGTTAVIVDAEDFSFVAKHNEEFPQIFPQPGWVEHNLSDIWTSVEKTTSEVIKLANISADQIIGMGITNQRETTCAFDKNGKPLYNALVWQDRRVSDFCDELKASGHEKFISDKTGLPIDAYFSAPKMRWLLKNVDSIQQASKEGSLFFGNIDTFLLYNLTGKNSFKTEVTNASRTMLMDLKNCNWDPELMEIFEVPKESLPEICDSFGIFGETKNLNFLPDGIPISGILGDQQSALFGQGGTEKGNIKNTYGTGAFMLLNTGEEIKRSNNGLLTTMAFRHKGKPFYALEGSCYIAGAAVQWLRDKLNIIENSPAIEELAKDVTNLEEMKNILFFPFFTGIGSPHWISDAQASIIGITRDTERKHIARSCLEGVAYSIKDLVSAFTEDIDFELAQLNVDGGMCANDLLMQIQADLLQIEIVRPKIIETTAFGAVLAAAIGLNKINIDEVKNFWNSEKVFKPVHENQTYFQDKYNNWTRVIKKFYC